jgi:hypothetical protein
MTRDKYEEGGLFVVERPLVLRTSVYIDYLGFARPLQATLASSVR